MADFASWSALLAAVRNTIANRDLTLAQYRTPDGTQLVFRSLDELIRAEGWISAKAEAASATAGRATRRVQTVPTSDRW